MTQHHDPAVAALHADLSATLARFGATIDRLAERAAAGPLLEPPIAHHKPRKEHSQHERRT
jgi:hypothetical protein